MARRAASRDRTVPAPISTPRSGPTRPAASRARYASATARSASVRRRGPRRRRGPPRFADSRRPGSATDRHDAAGQDAPGIAGLVASPSRGRPPRAVYLRTRTAYRAGPSTRGLRTVPSGPRWSLRPGANAGRRRRTRISDIRSNSSPRSRTPPRAGRGRILQAQRRARRHGDRRVLTCADSGHKKEPSRKFCLECGQRLPTGRPVCAVNPAVPSPAVSAATALGGSRPFRPIPRATGRAPGTSRRRDDGPATELRLISVMFVDLVDFTPLPKPTGSGSRPRAARRVLRVARELFDRHGGVIEKFIGDAVMAVWGTPVADEDDAESRRSDRSRAGRGGGRIESPEEVLKGSAGDLTGEGVVTTGGRPVAGRRRPGEHGGRRSRLAEPGTVLVGERRTSAASARSGSRRSGEQSLKGKVRACAGVAGRGRGRSSGGVRPERDARAAVRGSRRGAAGAQDLFHATEREGKPAAGDDRRPGRDRQEPAHVGAREVPRWRGRHHPVARGPFAVVRRGHQLLGARRDRRGRSGIAESDDPEDSARSTRAMLDEIVPDATERRWIEPD